MTDGSVTVRELADSKRMISGEVIFLTDNIFKDSKVGTFIEESGPFEMILKVADGWRADLIVLGTHGRTGFSHLLMGIVAEKVIRHSTKPLLIIPSK